MVADGAVEEARRAWPAPLSATARKVLGLEEFATLPEDDAVEAVTPPRAGSRAISESGCAACPGSSRSTATGLPEEIADEIVALERTGEHLPGHRGPADA